MYYNYLIIYDGIILYVYGILYAIKMVNKHDILNVVMIDRS